MKKGYLSTIILCLAVGCLCGCSAKDQVAKSTQPPLTVTVWTYYNGTAKEAFDGLVDEFNQSVGQEQNIIIDAYSQGDVNELAEAVLGAAHEDIGAQVMPNMFAAYSDSAYRVDQLGKVANLDDYFTSKELADFRPEFLEEGRFGADGALKIIPIAKSSENVFINETDFNKFAEATGATLGDMTSWEGLAQTAANYYQWTDQATQTPDDGKALFGMDAMANFMIIAAKQLDVTLYQTDYKTGETIINFPPEVARKIWDNFYAPFINGHYASIGRFRSDDAKTGDVLAYSGSTAGVSYFPRQIETGKDEAYPITCAVLPYPYFAGGKAVAMQQGAGMVIAKSDKAHEEASAVFLKWLTSTEQNLAFAASTGYLPVKNESLNFELFKKVLDNNASDPGAESSLASAEVTYKMLDQYSLYGSLPFEKSYEARKVLEKSLLDYAKKDLEQVTAAVAGGEKKADVIVHLNTDENFEVWYNQFMAEIVQVNSQ